MFIGEYLATAGIELEEPLSNPHGFKLGISLTMQQSSAAITLQYFEPHSNLSVSVNLSTLLGRTLVQGLLESCASSDHRLCSVLKFYMQSTNGLKEN